MVHAWQKKKHFGNLLSAARSNAHVLRPLIPLLGIFPNEISRKLDREVVTRRLFASYTNPSQKPWKMGVRGGGGIVDYIWGLVYSVILGCH